MLESDTLTVTPAAREIAQQLVFGAENWLCPPRWYRALTVHILPARLRQEFGFPYSSGERTLAEEALAWIRLVYPALPDRLRYVGPYYEARARLSGRARPDLATQVPNRLQRDPSTRQALLYQALLDRRPASRPDQSNSDAPGWRCEGIGVTIPCERRSTCEPSIESDGDAMSTKKHWRKPPPAKPRAEDRFWRRAPGGLLGWSGRVLQPDQQMRERQPEDERAPREC
jgi:hypothetical protein